jgi:hypothetical protein
VDAAMPRLAYKDGAIISSSITLQSLYTSIQDSGTIITEGPSKQIKLNKLIWDETNKMGMNTTVLKAIAKANPHLPPKNNLTRTTL